MHRLNIRSVSNKLTSPLVGPGLWFGGRQRPDKFIVILLGIVKLQTTPELRERGVRTICYHFNAAGQNTEQVSGYFWKSVFVPCVHKNMDELFLSPWQPRSPNLNQGITLFLTLKLNLNCRSAWSEMLHLSFCVFIRTRGGKNICSHKIT